MNLLQATARRASGLLGRESWLVRRTRPVYETVLGLVNGGRVGDGGRGGRGIPWSINGVTYRIDPHQRHRLGQNYDAPVAEFLRARVKPGAVCVDVGANVGVYVLQFAHWSGPSGRVVAFEPNPAAREVLQEHVRMNGLGERVQIVAAAVAEVAGEAVLYAADASGMSRLGAPNQALAGMVSELTVPVVTLDEYCKAQGLKPDWLFLDIEGFEIAALAGARELIASRRRELGLIVEMHPDVWDSANTTRAGATALLAELGLRAVPLTGQRDPLGDHGIVQLMEI